MIPYGGKGRDTSSHRHLLSKSGCDSYGSYARSDLTYIKSKLIKHKVLRRQRSRARRLVKEFILKELNKYWEMTKIC